MDYRWIFGTGTNILSDEVNQEFWGWGGDRREENQLSGEVVCGAITTALGCLTADFHERKK